MEDMELVILVDDEGEPIGSAPKSTVHDRMTPLHLAFSCYIFRADGKFLLTRRAATKKTWPGVWTNSCCGHPQPGENLADAMVRRVQEELGITPLGWGMILPDFRYRTVMENGVVENEVCPVFAAYVDDEPATDPTEVAEYVWLDWPTFRALVRGNALQVSPWCELQMSGLSTFSDDPLRWASAGLESLPERWRGPLGQARKISEGKCR